ncbi:cyclic nucleotide-binding domain-containing protein [Nitratireductor mangrovi]|uniref:Cyclic nucleotide-binding domain-containing protein n=1 Tax=Nitratireductor mangrovi TaxID=2599600 RepID=A0A5B8KYE3_9HYPH|nr:cyclic nucleotide-binding domain-containing protein [Nitratireductor mangrovi]QDZ00592.1 cyclic nucleotide-binding domain-containing protein [Nitratireductor mangrovi]
MRTLSDEVEVLRKIPLFASIEPAKLKLLAYACDKVEFADGQVLFRQGDEGDSAFIVLSGTADIVSETGGSEVVVAQLKDHALVGEMSVFCDAPRSATVRANGKLIALKIGKGYFLELIKEFPELAGRIIRELAFRLAKTTADLAASERAANS